MSFSGSRFSAMEKKPVIVQVDQPLPYYADVHRPLHFSSFAELEDIWVDREDVYS